MLEASRRHFLKAIAAAPLIGSAHRGRERPNLILLMADDLSARELSCYGNRDHATPNLDALARSGVRVETCWATPLCSPTRAELMTGRYGFRTGWYHNGMKPAAESPQAHLAQSNLTFAQLLKAAGYATAICGKWQLNGTVAEHAFDESCLWEDYPGFSGPRETAVDGKQSGRPARYWHPAIVENGTPLATAAEDYGPDVIADFALDFARRHRGQPFLIYYPMLLPHIAWDFEREMETWIDVPGLDEAGHPTGVPQRGSLQANIEYLDRLVGRIVEGLDALDLRERTILLFTSDNGSQGYGKNITVRERGPRVPLIVNGPTRVAARGAVEQLVDLSDILPTLVELAGGALPEGYAIDGRSFAAMLMNRAGPSGTGSSAASAIDVSCAPAAGSSMAIAASGTAATGATRTAIGTSRAQSGPRSSPRASGSMGSWRISRRRRAVSCDRSGVRTIASRRSPSPSGLSGDPGAPPIPAYLSAR